MVSLADSTNSRSPVRRAISRRLALLGGGSAGLGLAGRIQSSRGQSATPTTGADEVVGTWRVTVQPPAGGAPHTGLVTLAAGGTLTLATQPVQSAPPGSPSATIVFSDALGVWEPTATGIAFVAEFVGAFPDGSPVGISTLRGQANLGPDGQSLAATYEATLTTPDGTVVRLGPGSFQGVRLTINELATPGPEQPPAGTPQG